MRPFWKSKPQPQTEIQFRSGPDSQNDAKGTRYWMSTEDIDGYALFKLPPGVRYEFAKIVLRGVVSTKTNKQPPGSLQARWVDNTFKFLSLVSERQTALEESIVNGQRHIKIPFRFNLQEYQQNHRMPIDLPPSVDSKEDHKLLPNLRKYDADNDYSVTYSVTATAFSGRDLVATTTQKINVIPAADAQPPSYTLESPGEYSTVARTSPQTSGIHFRKDAGPDLEIVAHIDDALVLAPNDHGSFEGSTTLKLVVKLTPRASKSLKNAPLPSQCQIKAHLVTQTLVTPDGSGCRVSGARQAQLGENAFVTYTKGHDHEYTLSVPDWAPFSLDSGDDASPPSEVDFYLATLSCLYMVTNGKALHPTFNTPLLSRKYTVDLAISFPNGDGGMGHALKMALPVQIVHQDLEENREVTVERMLSKQF